MIIVDYLRNHIPSFNFFGFGEKPIDRFEAVLQGDIGTLRKVQNLTEAAKDGTTLLHQACAWGKKADKTNI